MLQMLKDLRRHSLKMVSELGILHCIDEMENYEAQKVFGNSRVMRTLWCKTNLQANAT